MKLKISVIILILLIPSVSFADEKSTIKSLIKFQSAIESSVPYSVAATLFADAMAEFKMSNIKNVDILKTMMDYDVSMEAYRVYTAYCRGVISSREECIDMLKMHIDNFNSGSASLNNTIKTQRKKEK